MRLDMRRIDHLRRGRSATNGEFAEQPFPHTALGPAHEAIVNRRWRPVFRRTITPSAAALQHMQDAADHAPIIHPILAPHVRRQQRPDPLPLLVAQPEQVASHGLTSAHLENRQLILRARLLLGFGPSV